MDALGIRAACAMCLAVSLVLPQRSDAADHRTENFMVTAQTKRLAVEIAEAAEKYRSELAIQWLGQELPRWHDPCPIQAKVDPRLGAGGATSFLFESSPRHARRPSLDGPFRAESGGRPFGWKMTIQGSRERILDSVLPHEVTHTIFATHFGQPLPRWADEGACTTVEHPSEKAKQHRMLYEFLTTERGIAFNQMFAMTEYPRDILPLYSQGFSLAKFLIAQGGHRKFIDYVGDGLNTHDWTQSTRRFYGFESLSDLQVTWLDWVKNNCPELPPHNDSMKRPSLISADQSSLRPDSVDPMSERQVRTARSNQNGTGGIKQQPPSPAHRLAVGPKPLLAGTASHEPHEPAKDSTDVILKWGTPADSRLAARTASATSAYPR